MQRFETELGAVHFAQQQADMTGAPQAVCLDGASYVVEARLVALFDRMRILEVCKARYVA